MRNDLMVQFSKAFFGGGSAWEKAVVAFEVAEYHAAFERHDVAALFDAIGDFYSKQSTKEEREKLS